MVGLSGKFFPEFNDSAESMRVLVRDTDIGLAQAWRKKQLTVALKKLVSLASRRRTETTERHPA